MTRRIAVFSLTLVWVLPSPARGQAPDPEQQTESPGESVMGSEETRARSESPPGEMTRAPSVLAEAEPAYPPAAREQGLEATAVLEITIRADGTAEDVALAELTLTRAGEPTSDPDPGFARAAIEAAGSMRFSPAEIDGVASAVRIRYTYRFELPQETPAAPAEAAGQGTEPPESADDEVRRPVQENFSGRVVERGTRRPLPGAVITVFRGEGDSARGYEAVTDAGGRFRFFDLEPGQWRVLAEADGYYPYRTSEAMAAGEGVDVVYHVERGTYNPYDVTVEAERPLKEVNRRRLSSEDITRVAGTLGDPVLVVENLPGVARAQPGSGDIIVRGSGPNDTGVFIDGIAVPQIYHFGGLRSVLPATLVEGVDLYPGNFSTVYGGYTGGIFEVRTKDLEPEKVGATFDVSMLDASAYLEAPLGDDAALAVAGRRSYIDAVLLAAVPDDAPVQLISAPRYYDYQVLSSYRPSREHRLRTFVFGSDDRAQILFEEPEELDLALEGGNTGLRLGFHRGSIQYQYAPSSRFRNTLSVAAGRDIQRGEFSGTFHFDIERDLLQIRDVATLAVTDRVELTAGTDHQLESASANVLAPRPPREGDVMPPNPRNQLFTDSEVFRGRYAAFAETRLSLGRFELVPGVRVEYFGPVDEVGIDPRVVGRLAVTDEVAVKAGAAAVHQMPTFQELDPTFGNPDLGLIRGRQYSSGVEVRPRDHLRFDLTGFYKQLEDLTSSTRDTVMRDGDIVPEVYNNGGEGRVVGLEFFAEHRFANNFRGWLAYTLSSARRTDFESTNDRPFDFDQTHILNLAGNYQLPRNWEVGLRWRLISGNPTTPIEAAGFNSDSDQYDPVAGKTNSDRLPMFHQLDLRVDKRWVYDAWILSAYLSLVNAYNHKNVESRGYNYDYSQSNATTGLPVFPIFGVKGEI